MEFTTYLLYTTIREEVIPNLCVYIQEFLWYNYYDDTLQEDKIPIVNAYLSHLYADLDVLQTLLNKCSKILSYNPSIKEQIDTTIINKIEELNNIYLNKYNAELLYNTTSNTLTCIYNKEVLFTITY